MVRGKYKKLPVIIRFWTKVKPSLGCWEWQGTRHKKGYGYFHWPNGKNWNGVIPANRASWILFHGPIPPGVFVCHKCDNRACVRPDHLWLGTVQDNQRDMVLKGRAKTCGRYNRVTGLKYGGTK